MRSAHVGERAPEQAILALFEELGSPKVDHFEVPVLLANNVFGLQIAVDDSVSVEVLEHEHCG